MTPASSSQDFRLLHVEDEEITRDAVRTMLARRYPGLSIQSAGDGAQGLELFRSQGADLVITDVKMPAMSGIEMARQILAEAPTTPVIVTSAHGDMDYLLEAIEIGVTRYVMKPIAMEKLFRSIDDALERVRLERELSAQQEAIVALNRHLSARAAELEAANRDLEAFSYTVSHDLRTPLTNINGYCQVILEMFGSGLDSQCREFIEVIYRESISMNELIGTLLEFSRLARRELSRTSTDLSRLAQVSASTLLLREPGRQVSFRIEQGVKASCDPDLMRVVLDNLLGNAFKYTGKKEQALIEFGALREGREPTYFVRDNGAGFNMAQAQKLFLPFQRLHTDEEFHGFGIGLATVQRVVQRHGGRIWAEGTEGAGASFYFTIPEPAQLIFSQGATSE